METNLYFPAFPDAQGAGRGTIGAGHAGTISTVYHVTTINDSGPGTLRDAVNATNRTVVFDIGGTITLNSPLIIQQFLSHHRRPDGAGRHYRRRRFDEGAIGA